MEQRDMMVYALKWDDEGAGDSKKVFAATKEARDITPKLTPKQKGVRIARTKRASVAVRMGIMKDAVTVSEIA